MPLELRLPLHLVEEVEEVSLETLPQPPLPLLLVPLLQLEAFLVPLQEDLDSHSREDLEPLLLHQVGLDSHSSSKLLAPVKWPIQRPRIRRGARMVWVGQ